MASLSEFCGSGCESRMDQIINTILSAFGFVY